MWRSATAESRRVSSTSVPEPLAPVLSAEESFLVQCARAGVQGSDARRALPAAAGEVADWNHVFRLAATHAVTPLVASALRDLEAPTLTGAMRAQLDASVRQAAARSLELTAGLLRVLEIFASHAIPAVPLRGPVLARSLYGSVAAREFCDLDVLIRREDTRRAKDVLVAHGYRTDLPVDPAGEAAYLAARHELHFTPADGSYPVEIHQCLLAPYHRFALDQDGLWERARSAQFCGRGILSMDPGDLLLALSAHATKHAWSRLGWICDVGRLTVVCEADIGWSRVMERAEALGARRMLRVALLLAVRVLGAPVPASVVARAEQDAGAARVARRVTSWLFDERRRPGPLGEHFFFVQARERVRDKVLYGTRLAFTPTEEDRLACALPRWLSPLYYPLHTARVIGKYGLGTTARCLGTHHAKV